MSDDKANDKVDDLKALDSARPAPEHVSKLEKEQEQSAEDLKRKSSGNSNVDLQMHVKVYSPFKDYFDGQAFSISAENATGPFDILPKHHNFISLLNPCQLTVRSARENGVAPIKINIGGGLMHVKQDEVLVFLDV